MTNAFLKSFDLKSSKDRELLRTVQQEAEAVSSAENDSYGNLSDGKLLQAWREAECAKDSEAVDLRLEIIRRGLTPDQ